MAEVIVIERKNPSPSWTRRQLSVIDQLDMEQKSVRQVAQTTGFTEVEVIKIYRRHWSELLVAAQQSAYRRGNVFAPRRAA